MSTQPRHFSVVPIRTKRTRESLRREADSERNAEFLIKRKVDQANALMDALEAQQAALSKQITRLQKRKAAACARYEKIEQATLRYLEAIGRTKLDGFSTSFAARPATPGVRIDDETLIPGDYLKVEEIAKPIKALIKAALDRGIAVPGVSLVQTISLIRR